LAKDKGGERIPPNDYSNREKESILKLSRVIELDYLNTKPHDYSDTKDYWEEVEAQIKFREKISKQADGPGNWPLPYFFVNPKGIFHYDDCENYRVAFGDTEEFNISFGLLIRNLIFAEAKKVFHLYYDLHSTAFIEFLEIHLLEYSFLFENSNLISLTEKWIKSIEQAKSNPSANEEGVSTSEKGTAKTPPFVPEIRIETQSIKPLLGIIREHFDPSQHKDLKLALEGKKVNNKLLFLSSGNRFVFVFVELQKHGIIKSDIADIKNWILKNFQFLKKSQAVDFKVYTVHKIFNLDLDVTDKKVIDISSLLN